MHFERAPGAPSTNRRRSPRHSFVPLPPRHRRHIAESVSSGLMSVQLQTSVPCTFGVLTVLNEEQAAARSYAGENHGESWGKTAVEMAVLRAEALGLAKKGTINLGFSDEDKGSKLPGAMPEKKVFF